MPFRYEPVVDRHAGTIADLLLRRGDIGARQAEVIGAAQARAAEQSGQAWAGAAQGIGNAVSGAIQQATDPRRKLEALQLTEQQRNVQSRDAFLKVIKDTPQLDEDGVSLYDIPAVAKQLQAAGVDPGDAVKHLGGINDAFRAEQAAKLAIVKRGAEGIIASGNDPTLAEHFLDQLEKNRTYPAEQITKFRQFIAADPDNVAKLTGFLVGKQELATAAPGSTIYNKNTGATVSTVPEKKAPLTTASLAADAATLGTPGETPTAAASAKALERLKPPPAGPSLQPKSVLLDGKPAEVAFNPKTNTYHLPGTNEDVSTRVKPIPPASTQVNVGQQNDADSIADAIADGSQPPDVKGLYRLGGPVRASLARKGYDLTKANLDWEATKKHLATLNGSKVTAMRSSISTASESLDVIDNLAGQWNDARIIKDGKLLPLNKIELSAAKQGLYGTKAQSIATQLEGQITDVVSELGQVYMGGNSPTDHALKLAEKNLKADWSAQTLKDMTKLARTNLQIRNNSIVNSGAVLSDGPAKNETSAVPANVGAVLKGQKAGHYTLSDGSVWTIGPDGSVTKGKP